LTTITSYSIFEKKEKEEIKQSTIMSKILMLKRRWAETVPSCPGDATIERQTEKGLDGKKKRKNIRYFKTVHLQ